MDQPCGTSLTRVRTCRLAAAHTTPLVAEHGSSFSLEIDCPCNRAPVFCRDVGSSESDPEGGERSAWVADVAAWRGGDVDRVPPGTAPR